MRNLCRARGLERLVEPDADAQLMSRVAKGDRAAFSVLFDRHRLRVARFAFRFVGDRALAEELAQDIFVKLFRSAHRYRPSATFKTFLFKVAANHCLNALRNRKPMADARSIDDPELGAPQLVAPAAESPDEAVRGRELEKALGEALRALSDRERAAFTMCRFEGMAYRDIAEALSASEAAVKSLIHRATLAVARKLDALQAGVAPERSRA
jgi:RNA polymerase sigma-70 factor (ECF subfamily)